MCVDAGAELASMAWTTSSSQLQMVKSSGYPTNTSLVSLSPTQPGSGHHRNDAIKENTFALFVGMCIRTATFIVARHIESMSLDLLTGQTAAAEAAEAFFSGTRGRAYSPAAQLIDVSSLSSWP